MAKEIPICILEYFALSCLVIIKKSLQVQQNQSVAKSKLFGWLEIITYGFQPSKNNIERPCVYLSFFINQIYFHALTLKDAGFLVS